MSVPYSALAVANTFIARYQGATGGIDHMKLQKLVYCAYGWWLTTIPLEGTKFCTEAPQVWPYGPVFGSLYHQLKIFGNQPIRNPVSLSPFKVAPTIPEVENESGLIDWIWQRYGHLNGFALSEMTHKRGTPWQIVAQQHDYQVPSGTALPDHLIREEFMALSREINNPEPSLV